MSHLAYNYSQIYLIPQYSELLTRSDAHCSVKFLGKLFRLPVVPSNMESVINEKIAYWLSQNSHFYIYHRFGDTEKFVQKTRDEKWKLVSISVGVNNKDRQLILDLAKQKLHIDIITIDIAHGHSFLTKNMIKFIKNILPDVKIIAGNVCTKQGVRDLYEWGANAVKVGIAGGGACSTKSQTGFHIPMFSCVEACSKVETKYDLPEFLLHIPIIADGGIRENGDIAKALVAGATMVMAGSIFAACKDAPGENILDLKNPNKITHKKYFGSASAKQKGENKHVEGFEVELPCNGMTFSEKYREIAESLASSISYAGGRDLSAFNKVEYINV